MTSESSDESGGDPEIIRLQKYDIEVRIPPNEAFSANDITVNAISDAPPELEIKENEAIITVGLEMRLPSNAIFGHPVQVTMPHCGRFTNPNEVEIVSYYRQKASKKFIAIPSSIGVSPRCVVRHSDLDIYFNHFSEYWFVAVLNKLMINLNEVFLGKRVICTPYIPVRPSKRGESCVLLVHVRDANKHEEEGEREYTAALNGEQFFFKWSSGSMKISCPESIEGDSPKIIESSDIRHLTAHKVMFKVDTRNVKADKMIVTLILEQSTKKELLISMHLTDSPSDTGSAASISTSVQTQDDCQVYGCEEIEVTDEMLNSLGEIPSVNYHKFCDKLGFGYDQAENILDKHSRDYNRATRECLAGWKNRATRSVADLHTVLISAGLGGKVDHLRM